MYLIFVIIRRWSLEKTADIIAVILMAIHLILNCTIMQRINSDIFVSNSVMMGFPCFWTGYTLHKNIDGFRNIDHIGVLAFGCAIYTVVYSCFFRTDLNLGSFILAGSITVMAEIGTNTIPANALTNFISYMGRKYSFWIYILHLYVIEIVDNTLMIDNPKLISLSLSAVRMFLILFIIISSCIIGYIIDALISRCSANR